MNLKLAFQNKEMSSLDILDGHLLPDEFVAFTQRNIIFTLGVNIFRLIRANVDSSLKLGQCRVQNGKVIKIVSQKIMRNLPRKRWKVHGFDLPMLIYPNFLIARTILGWHI